MARRWHRRAIAVIVEAVGARTVVDVDARRRCDDNPALGARSVPEEVDGFEVFEGGETVELVV